jgi:glycosyltransferase involved in cell wall biosynthesis
VKVLLLSPYDAVSHASWRQGLLRHLPQFDWTCLTLPARFFSWRIRGNSLTWGLDERALLERDYDLLLATSMTELATLRGLVPALARLPTLLYFHENQFAYPKTSHQTHSVEPQMVSLYAALCADTLVFNSCYNRDSFLQGVAELLQRLPDAVPAGVPERLMAKSQVLPVPVEAPPASLRTAGPPLELLWNHRWEYDKGPELLLACLEQLPAYLPLKVHVVGQQFRQQPEPFAAIAKLLQARGWQGRWGYVEDRREYSALLASCHLVLSTAHHDFQGLAVIEAVAAGCLPLVPDRLAYPEWFPAHCRYSDLQDLVAKLVSLVSRSASWEVPDVSRLTWPALVPQYAALLASTGGVATAGPVC